jgi:hypothetical protein
MGPHNRSNSVFSVSSARACGAASDVGSPIGQVKGGGGRSRLSCRWITDKTEDAETAKLDMEICRVKARVMVADFKEKAKKNTTEVGYLKLVAQQLRYQIATREPFVPEEASDAQIATLWGAKGITADHVYIVGLCDEAIPGQIRDEYPGTQADFIDEQRRLFYVSITRSKKTLVLSRPRKIKRQAARDIGLSTDPKAFFVITLQISRFLLEIMTFLPAAKEGDDWVKKL